MAPRHRRGSSGVSAGARYGRITSKGALILAIHDCGLTRMSTEFAVLSDEQRWNRLTTPDLMQSACAELLMARCRERIPHASGRS